MLHTRTVAAELLKVLNQLMELKSLQNFRVVGGTALALQIGHRESVDIDLFSSGYFPTEEIYQELIRNFIPDKNEVFVAKNLMIKLKVNGVKIDIVDDHKKFIRNAVVEQGIRMASLEDISAMKIKTTCDPFSGRKTRKDLMDIATLLDTFTIREMVAFLGEKYPTVMPYKENMIIELNKYYDMAERNSPMPKMYNELSWEGAVQKIQNGMKAYFDELLMEREAILKKR